MGETLGWLQVSGTAYEIGLGLGQAGRRAVHDLLRPNPFWQEVTGPTHAKAVALMAAQTQARFPDIWQEIRGLADGLGLPLEVVMAWNCRGDLLASVPDGCTTVLMPADAATAAPARLAHNEDGFPFLRGHSFVADLRPEGRPAIIGFCYPGSIPGHTFAVTSGGMVQTVNNIRLTGVSPKVPRMVLSRAVLAMPHVDAAIALLRQGAQSGGFHLGLCDTRVRQLMSVEYGGGTVSAQRVDAPLVHANHALHLPGALAHQVITRSSANRQARGEALLAQGALPLEILHDGGGPGLPILRLGADDPDDENTHATLLAEVTSGRVQWEIHVPGQDGPAYRG